MKHIIKLYLLTILFVAIPVLAVDGIAVIDMRTAVLSTQAAADAFKALEEDVDYSSNLEEAQSLQAERQAIAEKLQKNLKLYRNQKLRKCRKIFKKKVFRKGEPLLRFREIGRERRGKKSLLQGMQLTY